MWTSRARDFSSIRSTSATKARADRLKPQMLSTSIQKGALALYLLGHHTGDWTRIAVAGATKGYSIQRLNERGEKGRAVRTGSGQKLREWAMPLRDPLSLCPIHSDHRNRCQPQMNGIHHYYTARHSMHSASGVPSIPPNSAHNSRQHHSRYANLTCCINISWNRSCASSLC